MLKHFSSAQQTLQIYRCIYGFERKLSKTLRISITVVLYEAGKKNRHRFIELMKQYIKCIAMFRENHSNGNTFFLFQKRHPYSMHVYSGINYSVEKPNWKQKNTHMNWGKMTEVKTNRKKSEIQFWNTVIYHKLMQDLFQLQMKWVLPFYYNLIFFQMTLSLRQSIVFK